MIRNEFVIALRELGLLPEDQWPVPDADFMRRAERAQEQIESEAREQATHEAIERLRDAANIAKQMDLDDFAEELESLSKKAETVIDLRDLAEDLLQVCAQRGIDVETFRQRAKVLGV